MNHVVNSPGAVALFVLLPLALLAALAWLAAPLFARTRQTRERNRAIAARRRALSTRRTQS